MIITEPEQTDSTLAMFTKMYGGRTQVTKSHPRFTELTNQEASKGRALAILAAQYSIPQEEVMAIGDGYNDMDMIEWAGWGVAMASAPAVSSRSGPDSVATSKRRWKRRYDRALRSASLDGTRTKSYGSRWADKL